MKLLINDKYEDVGFWSFAKCYILCNLGISAIVFGAFFILGLLAGGLAAY